MTSVCTAILTSIDVCTLEYVNKYLLSTCYYIQVTLYLLAAMTIVDNNTRSSVWEILLLSIKYDKRT